MSTLEQLENDYWPEPEFSSHLVQTCHALRKKPLDGFSVEDLRIMIGQNIGLPFLLPIAIDILKHNLLIEGDFFAGDFLLNVVQADPNHYATHSAHAEQVRGICLVAIKMDAQFGALDSEAGSMIAAFAAG